MDRQNKQNVYCINCGLPIKNYNPSKPHNCKEAFVEETTELLEKQKYYQEDVEIVKTLYDQLQEEIANIERQELRIKNAE